MDGSEKLAKGIELLERKHESIVDEISEIVDTTNRLNSVFVLSEKEEDAINCVQMTSSLMENQTCPPAYMADRKNEGRVSFILGDDSGLTSLEREELRVACGSKTLTLGPVSLLAHHCVIAVHYELDKALGCFVESLKSLKEGEESVSAQY